MCISVEGGGGVPLGLVASLAVQPVSSAKTSVSRAHWSRSFCSGRRGGGGGGGGGGLRDPLGTPQEVDVTQKPHLRSLSGHWVTFRRLID